MGSVRLSRRLGPGLLVLLLAAGALPGAEPYLRGFDPLALLPPPPVAGGPEDRADRRSTASVYATRTPADVARGRDEQHVTIFHFASVIGPGFQPGKFPRTEALFAEVEGETKQIVNAAKNTWRRPRPFVADPARFAEPGDPEKSPGYPSGHSTRGTVLALLLAELFPDRRAELAARGREIGWTRVVIGVHTPLDIQAGRVLGQSLAGAFLARPEFQAELAAVRRELAAATLPGRTARR